MVQAFGQDALQTPPIGRCFRHVHPGEDSQGRPIGHAGLYLSDGLGQLGIAQEVLVEVTAERSVWASLLGLLPRQSKTQ